jgi:hypothetical protein
VASTSAGLVQAAVVTVASQTPNAGRESA